MLSKREISLKSTSLYMLTNILIGYIFGYSTLVYSTAGTGWLGWLELVCILLITTMGFINCRSKNENENEFFIYDFICLSVPIGFTTIFLFWSFYWLGWWSFGEAISNISIYDHDNKRFLFLVTEKGPTYSIFLVNILMNIFYFKRMKNALQKVRNIRGAIINAGH